MTPAATPDPAATAATAGTAPQPARRSSSHLPGDSHVHSEWSWDAPDGRMQASCERAVDLGLPSIAFTEHVDHTVWRVATEALSPGDHLATRPAPQVLDDYLDEVADLAASTGDFEVLAHIDYPLRSWPPDHPPVRWTDHEDRFRHALGVLARSGRALELNTRLPVGRLLLGWWREEGGRAVSFGSDAHEPGAVARDFRAAADTATAGGFRPGRQPHDLWRR